MLKPKFDAVVDNASHKQLAKTIKILLATHGSPVFGATKVVEHYKVI